MTTVSFTNFLNLLSVTAYSDGVNGTGFDTVTASLSSQVNVEPNGFVSDDPSDAAEVSLDSDAAGDSELDADPSVLDDSADEDSDVWVSAELLVDEDDDTLVVELQPAKRGTAIRAATMLRRFIFFLPWWGPSLVPPAETSSLIAQQVMS
ncbi:hypothetical protein [Calidifontibacter indicus]|uniref:hypothetical protein n=1 Tax=Calidifontibacter indicus TaxID=419650 RepID=UPI0011C080BB|nr:hypothetical protein [Calidifontibacter indicus]